MLAACVLGRKRPLIGSRLERWSLTSTGWRAWVQLRSPVSVRTLPTDERFRLVWAVSLGPKVARTEPARPTWRVFFEIRLMIPAEPSGRKAADGLLITS